MRERILLFTILSILGVFLYIFQNHVNTAVGFLILCACMVTYGLYSIAATKYQKRKLKKHPPVVNENYKPFVSIMVPAHNEASVIANTVENILAIDYPKFEIIVIDDRSTDNTAQVVHDLANKHENVIAFIRDKDAFPGKSAVLNDAMALAKGEAILVFDADATVESDFLNKLIPLLEPTDVGAVQARKVIRNKNFNFLTRCQNNEYTLDTHFQTGRDAVKGAAELRGNGELIKREALEDIGGWNNYTITDDLDMSTRLHIKGWDIRFCMDAIVYEEGIIYIKPLFRQRRRWLEGTIRRYLEFAGDIFTSKDMSLRVGFDLIVYISEFLLPFWMVSEILIQSFRFYKGYENTIQSYWVPMLAAGIFFWMGLTHGLQKYSRYSGLKAVWMSFLTSIYMVVLWVPVVFYMVLKIVFTQKTMEWGKTEHKGNN